MTTKRRVTITVDEQLLAEGKALVARGDAESLSAWANAALQANIEKERRSQALGDFIASYEVEFGEITDDEMAAQERADRAAARVVRSSASRRSA